jgi:exopolyphosphatase / guanosine-5'-triphosphate,3'-diphosphate pyrophosphatase
LASVHMDLPRYDRRAIDGIHVPSDAMRGISQHLARLSLQERQALPCIGMTARILLWRGVLSLNVSLISGPPSALAWRTGASAKVSFAV